MENYNIHVLGEAKNEYTRQLINILKPRVLEGIRSIYESSREVCEKHGDEQYLKKFQALLGQIPKWTNDILDKEWNRVMKKSDCDWLDELLQAVFVSHSKVLMAIKSVNKTKGNIEIEVPTGSHFLHQVYLETGRNFWKRPYLMYHKNPSLELQKNLYESELIVQNAVEETIRKMMPVKNILKSYVGGDYRDEEVDEVEEGIISVKARENLRKLVQEEIEQTLSYAKGGGRSDEINIERDEEKFREEIIKEISEREEKDKIRKEEVNDEISRDTLMEQINGITKINVEERVPEEIREEEEEENNEKRREIEITKKGKGKREEEGVEEEVVELVKINSEKLEKERKEDEFSFFEDAAPF